MHPSPEPHWRGLRRLSALRAALIATLVVLLGSTAAVAHADTVTPAGPTFRDDAQSVYIPANSGVRYHITQIHDGASAEVVWPDSGLTYAKPGNYTTKQGLDPAALIYVTAVSAGSATTLTGTQAWVHLLPNPATQPRFDDATGTITVPTVENATYSVNGTPMTSATTTLTPPATATVTVAPTSGPYAGMTAQTWEHRFAAPLQAPVFDDLSGTVTIPRSADVSYRIDGAPAAAGSHAVKGGTSVTVTAVDQTGATLQTWKHTFPTVVTPKGPTFDDRNTSLTIPSDWGVHYFVTQQGKLIAKEGLDFSKPGTYTVADGIVPGVAVRVEAKNAGPASLVTGTHEWTHTLPVRPSGSLAGGDEFNDPSPLVNQNWTPLNTSIVRLGPTTTAVHRAENLSVRDGALAITTRRHCLAPGEDVTAANASPNGAVCPSGKRTVYASGRMSTGFAYHGPFRMEVRARMADGVIPGAHFTAWVRNDQPYCNSSIPSSDLAELDTMEVLTEHPQNMQTSHITCYADAWGGDITRRDTHLFPADIAGRWHTYAMEWNGYSVTYTFDGIPMKTPDGVTETTAETLGLSVERFRSAMLDHPWEVIIDSTTYPSNTTWTKPPNDQAPWPERVDLVDYARITPLADVGPRGAIGDYWRGHRDLGSPAGPEEDAGAPGSRMQRFARGTVVWSEATGAHAVIGAIGEHYAQVGGAASYLGLPVSDEGSTDGGAYQVFTGGQIHWSPASGAQATHGAIGGYWGHSGYERGWLGYPTTDEFTGLPGGGASQIFQNGSLWWNPNRQAVYPVRGAIRAAYAALGYEHGWLGYPVEGEITGLAHGGASQRFEHGILFWDARTGAVSPTRGAIQDRYAAQGYEHGALGYPRGAEMGLSRDGGAYQDFEGGKIHWSPASGAHSTRGAIGEAWAAQRWENGRLGYPTSEELPTADGVEQHFQGGTLAWNRWTGAVVAR